MQALIDAAARLVAIVKSLTLHDVIILLLIATVAGTGYIVHHELQQDGGIRGLFSDRIYLGDTINGCAIWRYTTPLVREYSVVRYTSFNRQDNYVLIYSYRRRNGEFTREEAEDYCDKLYELSSRWRPHETQIPQHPQKGTRRN